MNKENWTTENIPDQKGKIIIVTGATSGLGKQASKILSGKNATVVMGVRNLEKAEAVKKEFISSKSYKSELKWFDGAWSRFKPGLGKDKRGASGVDKKILTEKKI